MGVHELIALIGVEILDRLAERDARDPSRARSEPFEDLLRTPLPRFSEDPSDRLADEELCLIEHRVGISGESAKGSPVLQRLEHGQQGRSPHPEVPINGPAIESRFGPRMTYQEPPDHVT